MGKVKFLLGQLVLIPIKMYQLLISPWMRPSCRYYPSCSHYAKGAIEHFGVFYGLWMALKRILRCHPWSSGGYDPVPHNDEKF